MIDVVYILGNESKWQDKEILYSIRSVAANVHDLRKIFLVGKRPYFLNDKVIEIPYDDIYHNKARNIMAKIHRAASDHRITNNFLLLNDDYFILQPIKGAEYPYYYKSDLKESMEINRHNLEYFGHLQATYQVLKDIGRPTKNFDCHYPIVYNKAKFRKVCSEYNWRVPAGYVMRSIYCNTLGIEGEMRKDCKVNHPHTKSSWERLNEGMECLSIGDKSCNTSFENYLYSLFPAPSTYEH